MNDSPKNAGKNSGRIMMVVAWVLGMVLAIQFFSSWEKGRANPNQSPESIFNDNYTEVILKSGRGGHYVATGYINDQAVTFMVDTGATSVAVSEPLANRLGLKKGMAMEMSTANGISKGWTTTMDSVRLGGIEQRYVQAIIASNMDDDVLLGMSFLRSLEFSQRNNELIVRQYKSNQ